MFHSGDFHLLHFLDKIENQWWTGRVLEGLCCHWELCLNGHCLLWAWFCSSRGFSFADRILSRQYWVGLPCLTQSGCILWQSLAFSAHFPPVLWRAQVCLAGESCPSPVPRSGTLGRLCFLYGCHFSSHGTVVWPSPTSQGGWQFVYWE